MERRELTAWSLVALSTTLAAYSIFIRPLAPTMSAVPGQGERSLVAENQRLRRAADRLRNEALALRAELDRMLLRLNPAVSPVGPAPSSGAEREPADSEGIARKVEEIAADIGRLSADIVGNPENFKALFGRISQLQAMGPEALPAVRRTFSSASDPSVRRILGSLLAMRGTPDDQQLILDEAGDERDPETKQSLLAAADAMGGETSARARAELRRMASAPQEATRANAIRNLSDLSDPETAEIVQGALAADASESVRFAALDSLLRDPERREQALAAAMHDASPRIRDVAECRTRLADLEPRLAAGDF